MNSIIGSTDLMSADEKDPATIRQARRLENIGRNGRHLLAVINDILDLSRIEADRLTLDFEPLELPPLLNDCLKLASPLVGDKPVELRAEIPSTMATWTGDEVRLRQIITNLLGNAAKFTQQGAITLKAIERGGGFMIAVSDTGVGIAPEHLPYVFDAFRQVDASSTRRAGGTGLGLAICRRLCALMGGEITARSSMGQGSTFEVQLPWAAKQCDMDQDFAGERTTPEQTRLMLLCTDDEGMVDLASVHMSTHGIEVRQVDADAIASGPLAQEPLHGVMIDTRCPAANAMLRIVAKLLVPRVWLVAWTQDHQLGCHVELDGVISDLRDRTAVLGVVGWGPSDTKDVLLVAGSKRACAELRDSVAAHGCKRIRIADGLPEAIGELTCGNVATVVLHLTEDVDVFELIERARGVPEWGPVRIVGVVSDACTSETHRANSRAPDPFLRRHGESTPTLLFDAAEQILAEPVADAVGAHA